MTLKEDIDNMKKELKEVKEDSLAMSFVKEYKTQRNIWCVAWFITFICFIGLLTYNIYLLNDIQTIETTETYDMDAENGNNNYIGGDNNGTISNN